MRTCQVVTIFSVCQETLVFAYPRVYVGYTGVAQSRFMSLCNMTTWTLIKRSSSLVLKNPLWSLPRRTSVASEIAAG